MGYREKSHRRISLAQTAPTDRQVQRIRAVAEVFKSFSDKSEKFALSDPTASQNGMQQQLCPIQALPEGFLSYESDLRPNPLFEARGSKILDTFQESLLLLTSAVKSTEPLYHPQGTHPVTGQALPPLLNCPTRLATGEDIASLSNTISRSSFAFQVINNNYHVSTLHSGSLKHPGAVKGVKDFTAKQKLEGLKNKREIEKKRSTKCQSKTLTQLTFQPPTSNTVRKAEIPRCSDTVASILRWWVRPDPVVALEKALMEWSVYERNRKLLKNGKQVSSKALYAKRKTIAMAFFHFCSERSVKEYEKAFTSLSESKMIKQNYGLSCAYSKSNDLKKLFNEQFKWIEWTKNVLRKDDVKSALWK